MKGKRARAGRLFARLGLATAVCAVRPRLWRGVTILAYHRVLDVEDEETFPFDIELVSASVAAFTLQMEFLRAHYRPMTFATLLEHIDAGESPRGAAVVTFDDGFSDNYEQAFPVLHRLGIPATIFLSTGYLDSQQPYWYEQVSHAVLATAADRLALPGLAPIAIGSGTAARRAVIKDVMKWLKSVPNRTRLEGIETLKAQLGGADPPLKDRRSAPLTWDQVKEMSAAGIEFGSHSVTHPVLSRVEPEQLAHELAASKRRIEEAIGKPVDTFAYPVGGEDAYNDRVLAGVRSAGYRLAVSYQTGVAKPCRWNSYAIPRLAIEPYMDPLLYKATLAVPEVFAY
jgi:peptidoglycan/xylan/chitin deacetylase (PgdA/CDA1 family)